MKPQEPDKMTMESITWKDEIWLLEFWESL